MAVLAFADRLSLLMRSIRYLSRFILFLMGYMWITEHGQRDPRVRIALGNHNRYGCESILTRVCCPLTHARPA